MNINYHAKYDDGRGLFPNQNLLLEKMTAENDKLQQELDELHVAERQAERQKEIEEAGYVTNLPRHIQQNILIKVLIDKQTELRDDLKTVDGQITVAQRNLQQLHKKQNIKFSEEYDHNRKVFDYNEQLYNSQKRKEKIQQTYTQFEKILTGRLRKLSVLDELSKRRMAEFSR